MKKTIFLLAMTLIALITIRCKKDADIPALNFEIDVKTDATISEKGINDESVIKFDMKTDYDYVAAPLSYKVDYSNIGILKHEGNELNKDTTYKLDKPEFTLTYIGKEPGKHNIKVHFFNDKGVNIIKTVEIPYVKYNFTLEVTGDETLYQGETKEYKLKITPENSTIKDTYKIKFISYDENDVALEKSYVAFNGKKIEFNKEYLISDLSAEQLITLKSFNAGTKNLVYTIINSSSEKQNYITQTIKKSQIEVKNLAFNKLVISDLGENLQVRGFIIKTPDITKYIQCKTWIVDVPNDQKDGVENTDNTYKEYILPDNNEFLLNVKVNKYGTFKYMIQFKDEFGNETSPYSFEIRNRTFAIHQIDDVLTNKYQGQDISFISSIKKSNADDELNPKYKIRFLEFDPKDINLQKSYIKLNGNLVKLNVESDFKVINNNIVVNSFHHGNVKLVYEVWNVETPNTKVRKETTINIKQAAISANLSIDKTKTITSYPFIIQGKVNTLSREGKIYYKTWVKKEDPRNTDPKWMDGWGLFPDILSKEITSTEEKWVDYTLNDNNFSISNQTSNEDGKYKYYIQFKDEFGNESEVIKFDIKVTPPIIIHRAYIDMGMYYHERGIFRLTIKAESLENSAKLQHAIIHIKRKTYTVERFGKNHSITIKSLRSNEFDEYIDLYNSVQIEREKVICYNPNISVEWNVYEAESEKVKSIKSELINKLRDDYFEMTVLNNKGQSLNQKVPIETLGFLLQQ